MTDDTTRSDTTVPRPQRRARLGRLTLHGGIAVAVLAVVLAIVYAPLPSLYWAGIAVAFAGGIVLTEAERHAPGSRNPGGPLIGAVAILLVGAGVETGRALLVGVGVLGLLAGIVVALRRRMLRE